MYILERLNVQKKTESEYIKQKLINMGFQVIVEQGENKDSVVVVTNVAPVQAMEKLYMTVIVK